VKELEIVNAPQKKLYTAFDPNQNSIDRLRIKKLPVLGGEFFKKIHLKIIQ